MDRTPQPRLVREATLPERPLAALTAALIAVLGGQTLLIAAAIYISKLLH